MNHHASLVAVSLFLPLAANAADPAVHTRHVELEQVLKADARRHMVGKQLATAGGIGLAVSGLTAGAGALVAASKTALDVGAAVVIAPYSVVTGIKPSPPARDDTAETMLITAGIAAAVSAVVLTSGLVTLGTTATSAERLKLEREQLIIEGQLRVEERERLKAMRDALDAAPTAPPTLVPADEPHRAPPLRAVSDAPVR